MKSLLLFSIFVFCFTSLASADEFVTCESTFKLWMKNNFLLPEFEGNGFGKLICTDQSGNQRSYRVQIAMSGANVGKGISSGKNAATGSFEPVRVSSANDISGNYRGATVSALSTQLDFLLRKRESDLQLKLKLNWDMSLQFSIVPTNWKFTVKEETE